MEQRSDSNWGPLPGPLIWCLRSMSLLAQGEPAFFLMPNEQGAYRRADPQKESDAATRANQRHHELLLPLIRLIMYWNQRPGCPTLAAYYPETIAMKSFAFQAPLTSLPEGLKTFFQKAQGTLWAACPDPKGLGPPLDEAIDWQTQTPGVVGHAERCSYCAARLAGRSPGPHQGSPP